MWRQMLSSPEENAETGTQCFVSCQLGELHVDCAGLQPMGPVAPGALPMGVLGCCLSDTAVPWQLLSPDQHPLMSDLILRIIWITDADNLFSRLLFKKWNHFIPRKRCLLWGCSTAQKYLAPFAGTRAVCHMALKKPISCCLIAWAGNKKFFLCCSTELL